MSEKQWMSFLLGNAAGGHIDRLDPVAQFAERLIERWGMVVSVPDGEDATGRAKYRLATPSEVVKRACDTASLSLAEFEKRGWIMPDPDEKPDSSKPE